ARGDHLAAQAPACRLQLHLTADGALEVLARAQGPLRARRGDLDRVAVEVWAEHRRDPLAERVVDAARLVDVDAEALLAGELEGQDLDPRNGARDGAGNLAVQLSLLVVRTRHHKKWAPRAHFKTAEMWCLQGSREVYRMALFEHDRDRSVVHELDLHPGAEDARLDGDAELAERVAEPVVDRLGALRARSAAEARPVALRRVGDQRELRHGERGVAGVE